VVRGGLNPSRTYRYLLESPYDMKLLEELATGQLALINVADGRITRIGCPAMIRTVSVSPEARHFRVGTMEKPFSYFVPMTRFGSAERIWDLEGKTLATVSERKLQETEPQPGAGTNQPARISGSRTNADQPQMTTADPVHPPTDPVDPADPYADPPDVSRGARPAVDSNARRDIRWRPDGAGLSFLQLEAPGKDTNAPRKDQVLQWLPPFGSNDVKVLYASTNRISSLEYSEDCLLLFLTQTVDNQRQICAVDAKNPATNILIYKASGRRGGETSRNGAAADTGQAPRGGGRRGGPGGEGAGAVSLLTRSGPGGLAVVRCSSAGDVYLSGTERGNTNSGPRPYLDRVNLRTGKKDRLFEAPADVNETLQTVDADDIKQVFTSRQERDEPPNYYVRDLASGAATKLTDNVNQTPWFNQFKVENLIATRVDGFKFRVKVTTPPNRTGRLPAMFWIYPREYTNQAAYDAGAARGGGAGGGNTNRFLAPGPHSITLLCLLDYAVVEPDMPIVGPSGRMNDNYVPNLRNSLWAVIDLLDKRGIIDRDRLAVGGHSYGAFSTANALVHTPFFKAGIAGDGNYNRTLTAMTFQNERRDVWNARETYLEMSPILWANQVNGALLMYHGLDDANVGTDPINAEHMFMALDGLGKPAALYMYPYEDHIALARETILDQWARWAAWLEKYVKNPAPEKAAPAAAAPAEPKSSG
jgi:hypothetical protein